MPEITEFTEKLIYNTPVIYIIDYDLELTFAVAAATVVSIYFLIGKAVRRT